MLEYNTLSPTHQADTDDDTYFPPVVPMSIAVLNEL